MPKYKLRRDCQIPGLDGIYRKHLGYKTDGVFVEVGAYDGESWSNTCCLADLGWRGLYIEPVRAYFEKCDRRHARNANVMTLHLAVGASVGTAEINVGGPLSTISDVALKNFKRMGWWKGRGRTETVQMLPLDGVLETWAIAPGFDLLVVDVEGYEWEVFKGFDVERWRPRMVIVELHLGNPRYKSIQEDCEKIAALFERHEYRPVFRDLSNTVYVKS